MSEWGGDADDDSDREEELRQRTEKRKRKSNAGIIDDDEEEYDGDGDSGHPDACAPAVDVGVDSSSVYSSVMAFVAAAERANNTRPSDTTTPTPTPIPVPVPGRGVTPDLATQPFYIDKATLHAHQMSALNWIKARFEMGVSAILADEMGLGKVNTQPTYHRHTQTDRDGSNRSEADRDSFPCLLSLRPSRPFHSSHTCKKYPVRAAILPPHPHPLSHRHQHPPLPLAWAHS